MLLTAPWVMIDTAHLYDVWVFLCAEPLGLLFALAGWSPRLQQSTYAVSGQDGALV